MKHNKYKKLYIKICHTLAAAMLFFILSTDFIDTDRVDPNVSQDNTLYQVTRVVDGDTVKIDMNGQTKTLRLIGIDTPETVHPKKDIDCYGPEASEYTKQTLTDQYISLEYDQSQGKEDKYGRLLVYIFYNGENFNQTLIEQGYASEYTYNTPYKYQQAFQESQDQAWKQQLGMWGVCGLEIES